VPYTIFVPHPSNFLSDHLPIGDGLVAWAFLDRLAARGHRLHVACQRVDVDGPPRDGLRLYRLSDARKLRVSERVRYMRRTRRLYAAIAARERIDIVHQLNPVDLGISLALSSHTPPIVLGPYWPEWPPVDGGPRPLSERVGAAVRYGVRALQQHRAELVLLSTPAAGAMVPRPLRDTRLEVLAPGIEAARFAPSPTAADREPTVLFLANLQARKGIFTLLDAFELVLAAVPSARLVVGGDGPDGTRFRERVAASPAAPRVELLGRLGRDAIAPTLAAADVYCLPSFGEPFGVSALEAMAAGLPLVTTRAGGLAHLAPPDGGIQVAPRDARALADALVALLRDPARRAAMAATNRAAALERYDWDRVIDRLEELYSETVRASR
jgi:glycosyltransferase involved in cell wall biosynthesis